MTAFKTIGLRSEILLALEELEFETPTTIQEKTIPYLLSSQKDLIALAQTGTGKTAAFSLPILEQIDPQARHVQSIILCPTRELCLQITKDIKAFSKHLPDISIVPVYGGERMDIQLRALKKGCQIVVGTPGRVHDFIRKKKLNIESIQYLVLDEADEMLNMGFKEDLDAILGTTPKKKQTLLFSATMLPSVEQIAKKYMRDTQQISASKRNTGTENVEHKYYMVHAKDRYEALRRIADMTPDIYGIVFCRTRRETQEVATKLMGDHYSADALHGDIEQKQREHVMNRFRRKQIQILVATDVAARGIDVNDLTHVINYNLPDQLESYLHRSGRTGRANKKGIALTIIHMKEVGKIHQLERKIGRPFQQVKVPTGKEICEMQLLHLIDKVGKSKVDEARIAPFLPMVYKKLESLSREELIEHMVSIEFHRFLEMYKNAPDLNVELRGGGGGYKSHGRGKSQDRHRDRGGKRRDGGGRRNQDVNFAHFEINFGSEKGFNAKNLFMLINKQSKLRGVEIGKISVGKSSTAFDADERYASALLSCFKRQKFWGTPVEMKKATGGGGRKFGKK